jgi:hypothetical protein
VEIVAIEEAPDWTAIAPHVVRLRTSSPPPAIPFPRLSRLELFGRAIDDVSGIPAGLAALSLHSTSVLDLGGMPRTRRLDLYGSPYAVTHGFGARRHVAPGFLVAIDDLASLGLGRTHAGPEVLAEVIRRSPRLEWIDLNESRGIAAIDLTRFARLRTACLSNVHAHRVALPPGVRALNLFRTRVAEPVDLSTLAELEVLDLSYVWVPGFVDAVLSTLPHGVPLRKVHLAGSIVSAAGLAALADRAPNVGRQHLEVEIVEVPAFRTPERNLGERVVAPDPFDIEVLT